MKSILLLFLLYSFTVTGQSVVLEYDIFHKGKLVGNMELSSKKEGTGQFIKMHSSVEIKFLLSIIVKVQEDAAFQNGKLISSSSKRTVNGKTRLDNQTRAAGQSYQVIDKGKPATLPVKHIDYNLLLLYFKEPINSAPVYSDAFQKLLSIQKLGAHHYRLDLPNNDYNEYYFENGICTKVIVHSTLFKIEMKLKK